MRLATVARMAFAAGSILLAAACAGSAEGPHAPLPVSAPANPPNIVLIAIDTVRADHLGCYGYGRATSPAIDRLAKQGVLFEDCYSAASWTLPSFASVMTGLLPVSHGCVRRDSMVPKAAATLPERLSARGYYCAAVVANPFLAGKYGFSRGFNKYDDFTVFLEAEMSTLAADGDGAGEARNRAPALSDVVTGAAVTRQAKKLVAAAAKTGKPFFLFVHYFDPHDSYIPPAPFDKAFDPKYAGTVDGKGLFAIQRAPPRGADLEHLIALYDGEIAYDDDQVRQVLAAVDSLPDSKNTLFVFMSDHGESFGERGMLLHGNGAFREEVHVPMVWRWPGVLPAGRRAKTAVTTLDIPKTLADLARVEGLDCQGQSLWPALVAPREQAASPGDRSRAILSEMALEEGPQLLRSHHVALTRNGLRLHARFAGDASNIAKASLELYDVAADPGERDRVDGVRASEVASMKAELFRIWSDGLARRARYRAGGATQAVDLDEKERRRLQGLGYTSGSGK